MFQETKTATDRQTKTEIYINRDGKIDRQTNYSTVVYFDVIFITKRKVFRVKAHATRSDKSLPTLWECMYGSLPGQHWSCPGVYSTR